MVFMRKLHEIVEAELPRMFTLAYLVCDSRAEALDLVGAALAEVAAEPEGVLSAARPADALFQTQVLVLGDRLGRKADRGFAALDELQRAERFRNTDDRSPPVTGSRGRDLLVRAELRRRCMVAVLTGLAPGMRLAFVLVEVFGYSPRDVAALMREREKAVNVRLRRARSRVEEYLLPRCGHVDPYNVCSCAGLMTSALEEGFVRLPVVTQAVPLDLPPTSDVGALYRALSGAALAAAEREGLLAALWMAPLRPPEAMMLSAESG